MKIYLSVCMHRLLQSNRDIKNRSYALQLNFNPVRYITSRLKEESPEKCNVRYV